MLSLNKVPLLGTLPEEPKRVYREYGAPPCSITRLLEEKGQEPTYRLYVPVDIFSERPEEIAEAEEHLMRVPYVTFPPRTRISQVNDCLDW